MIESHVWVLVLALQGVDTVIVPHTLEVIDKTSQGWIPGTQLFLTFLWLVATLGLLYLTNESLKKADASLRAAEEANRITSKNTRDSSKIARDALKAAKEANEITRDRTKESNKLSRRAVEAAEKTTAHQIRVHETDILLATYPGIHVTMRGHPGEKSLLGNIQLTVHNIGNAPAYDIEMYVYGHNNHVDYHEDNLGNVVGIDDYEELNVLERVVFPVLPKGHEYMKSVHTGADYQSYRIMMQFLDITGSNHIEYFEFSSYWFTDDTDQVMNLTKKSAEPLKKHPRIIIRRETGEGEPSTRKTEVTMNGTEEQPDYLTQDYIDAIERKGWFGLVVTPNFDEGKLVRSTT